MDAVTVLYRPVGQREYEWIADNGFRRFPPRLPEQPYFYPVTNEEYAGSGVTRHVLRFRVATAFLALYPVRTVGSSIHQEFWIPAGDLDAFNDQIQGAIERMATFR